MEKIKAVIVGCGGRAAPHLDADRLIPGVEITACCAPGERRRKPLAEKYGLREYDDLEKMLATEEPDLVHLVTPPSTRAFQMTLVSDHGIPFCTVEKPLATSVADYRALSMLSKKSETRFAVSHQFRWFDPLAKIRRHVAEGGLGTLKRLEMTCGMNLMGQGTHVLHYGRSLNRDSRVAEVFGAVAGWDEGDPMHGAPLMATAEVRFENGVGGTWSSGRLAPRAGDPATSWQHVRVAAHGDLGRGLWEEFAKWETLGFATGQVLRETGDWGGWDAWRLMNVEAQAAFHRELLSSKDPGAPWVATNLVESLHECAVVFALYESSLTSRPVSLDGFEPEPGLMERVRARG